MRHARRAFTLLEVLVAIGIILFLMTIGVLAFRHFDELASKRLTGTVLNSAKSMQVEFENSGQGKSIEDFVVTGAGNIPIYTDGPNPNNYAVAKAIFPFNGMTGVLSDPVMRDSNPAVQQTRQVMTLLLRMPKNVTALNALPTKLVRDSTPPNSGPNRPPQSSKLLLDGWSNPIIYVPRGGLINVRLKTNDTTQNQNVPYVVRSSGTFLVSDLAKHPVGPLDRPFWASAGPDGDLATGDDNVYSFQD